MALLDQLGGILRQYTEGQSATPPQPEKDLEHVATHGASEDVAHGLATAFRSDQTPSFGEMVSQLFSNSNPSQRAGLLGTLISAGGPALLSKLVSLGGVASELPRDGQPVSPEQAAKVSPETVQEIASHAEKQDPSIVDRVSQYYSQHPQLIATMGKIAATVALMGIANRMTKR
jgi:hypothetical protein